jgi:hypothetical protein
MRPGINFSSNASPCHIIHSRTFISGYDLSEIAKYCAQYPKCFEITEFCNVVAVRSSRGSGTNIFRKETYNQEIYF